MSERGDTLRRAADLIAEVAEEAPDYHGDDETRAEFEREFGEVPSYQAVMTDIASTTRQMALMMDVEAETEEADDDE